MPGILLKMLGDGWLVAVAASQADVMAGVARLPLCPDARDPAREMLR